MDMNEKSIDQRLEEFKPTEKNCENRLTRNISIPVPEAYKIKYEKIQSRSSNQFIDMVREMLMDAIDKVSSKIS